MVFYLSILGIIGFLDIISKFQKRKSIHWLCWCFVCLYVLFLACFRAESVGTDLVNYKENFKVWGQLSFRDVFRVINSDIGFVLYNWLVGHLCSHMYFFIICSAVITMVPVYITLHKYSHNPFMSLYLYICLGYLACTFNLVRQAIAISVLFYSYRYIVEKKTFKYFLCVIIAASFHKTALIAVLICFFINENRTHIRLLKSLLLLFSVIAVTFIGMSAFVDLYNINDYSNAIVTGEGIPLLMLYILLGVCFYMIQKCPGKETKEERQLEWRNLFTIYMIGVIVQISAVGFALLNRLTTYFMVFVVIFIPNILENMKDIRERTIAKIAIYGLYTLWFIYELYNDYSGIVPYAFMWS